MILGLRTKNKKGPSVRLDYQIHVQEVKPWPPSESLRNLHSVLIQWEHGDRNSGSTNPVVPSLGSGIGDGKIEFNESFMLPVKLLREMSTKGGDCDTFQKNCLEFNLYELKKDKTVRGQLLGTAIVDLADYGVVKETLHVSVPMNSKRSLSNTSQPVLFISIQSIEKGHISSSSGGDLSKEASSERNRGESVSVLMQEEYAEEAELELNTDDDDDDDDDVFSQISLEDSSSAFENNEVLCLRSEEKGLQTVNDSPGEAYDQHHLPSNQELAKLETEPGNELHGTLKVSLSCSSSTDLSSDIGSLENSLATLSNPPDTSITLIPKEENTDVRSKDYDHLMQEVEEEVADAGSESDGNAVQGSEGNKPNSPSARLVSPGCQGDKKLSFAISIESQVDQEDNSKAWSPRIEAMNEAATADAIHDGPAKDIDRKEDQENGQGAQISHEEQHSVEDEPRNRFSQVDARKQVSLASDAACFTGEDLEVKTNTLNSDKLEHVKSIRSAANCGRSIVPVRSSKLGDAQSGTQGFLRNERKDTKVYSTQTRNITSDCRLHQLEHRIKMLEGELREAAAIEFGLYSVVAEHGSSVNKVHAPARRLSRLYLHACKGSSQSRRASTARSAASGLVRVAKACGNDVPRLTFWLSNSVVLRAIISQEFAEQQLPISAGHYIEIAGNGNGNDKKLSPFEWNESSPSKGTNDAAWETFDEWEDPCAFTSILEKIEAWIFSRIIESIWWQTLIPHMQSAAAKTIRTDMASSVSKIYRRTSNTGYQEQVNFSLHLWKKAFKEAFEQLCPVRAGGHACGCLPLLARLIMEQCMARLDVAMFNAILRESDGEIPTDPISDPISDAKVLPIPAGKASFGAGAQLKNVIGNWSRWFSDLFGTSEDDSHQDKNDSDSGGGDDDDGERKGHDKFLKSFHLLKALSDLMMLPKMMLLRRSTRKEVCPTFGTALIKRVIKNFVPDKFCPDVVPKVVLEALDSEDPFESGDGSIVGFPCSAAPIVYLPPPVASVASIIEGIGSKPQPRRSGSLMLKKSYTSDDELDEFNSPLSAIIGRFQASATPKKTSLISKENSSQNGIGYQLLREVWMNND